MCRFDEVWLTDDEAAELERRLANPPTAPTRPVWPVRVVENPSWLTGGGQGYNFVVVEVH